MIRIIALVLYAFLVEMLNWSSGALAAGPDDFNIETNGNDAVLLQNMEIIGVTPISGTGLALQKIPANVQSVDAEDLSRAQSLNLPEYLNRNLGSVNINNATTNPFQPDVRFRGFTASPLLGLPQGLSVYVNGVRFNEPFGDTVNWDLIPGGAIEQMNLHPGSNPVYGLNTLGGAISINTKTGFSAPTHQFKSLYGSWERHDIELTSGANNGTLGYFIDMRNFGEQGWRDFSASKVNQGFGTFSWRGDSAELDVTLAGNESDLNGNGAVPIQLNNINPSAVFTHPDNTRTALFLASMNGLWQATDRLEFSANAFYRRNHIKTFNGDDSDFEECESVTNNGLLCEEEDGGEAVVIDVNGNPVIQNPTLEGATNNFSQTQQETYGGTLQSSFFYDLFGMGNQLIVGGNYQKGVVNFEFDTELASITPDRGTIGSGLLVENSRVRLHSRVRNWGIYLSDTLSVTEHLALTLSGRFNQTKIVMRDRFGTELNGQHFYERFNPAVGLTYAFDPDLTVYGRYSESSRAPTPVELSCADPEAPCKLPNAFLSDPPLKQVVAKTWEAGFKGGFDGLLGGDVQWNAGYYHTLNNDDILFISAGNLTNQGFFSNVGTTRRQGFEIGAVALFDELFSEIDNWRFGLNYSYIDATFQTPFIASSPNNPSANTNGQTIVRKGNRLPGIPEHLLKLTTDVTLWTQFSFGVDMLFNSDQYYRGDEANLNDRLAAYIIFNLRAEYRINDYIALFGRLDNLFDQDYQTFGLYGQADEVLGGAFNNPRFISPGSPRAGWLGNKTDFVIRVSINASNRENEAHKKAR